MSCTFSDNFVRVCVCSRAFVRHRREKARWPMILGAPTLGPRPETQAAFSKCSSCKPPAVPHDFSVLRRRGRSCCPLHACSMSTTSVQRVKQACSRTLFKCRDKSFMTSAHLNISARFYRPGSNFGPHERNWNFSTAWNGGLCQIMESPTKHERVDGLLRSHEKLDALLTERNLTRIG